MRPPERCWKRFIDIIARRNPSPLHRILNEEKRQRTSDPAIYAAGDAVATRDLVRGEQIAAVPLGEPANRQGRGAADHIFLADKARPYPGSLGTDKDVINLDKLDRTGPVVTVCTFGKMNYFAAPVLAQNGFSAASFSGGLKANVDPRSPASMPTP